MDKMIIKLKDFLEKSSKILVTSHISPDPDAISSLLLLGTTLETNYPDKKVEMVLEEKPEGLDFLSGYDMIKFGPLLEAITEHKPDLIILLDGSNFDRASRENAPKVRQYIEQNNVKTIIIDHHEPEGKDNVDIYFNQNSPATTLDVYEILYNHLRMERPVDYQQTALLGIYADSGGFVYHNNRYKEMFRVVNELLDAGANLESVKTCLNTYSDDHMKVIGQLVDNLTHGDGYSYSFISDEFAQNWRETGKNPVTLKTACSKFIDNYIRNIGGRNWGFIVYPDLSIGQGIYSASFRSVGGQPDVAKIASNLGGGGHKPAAGAKIQAQDIDEAIREVQEFIHETKS